VSFPLLADFHPRGEIAKLYGVFLEKAGITDRATIIIDMDGIVRYAESVGPGGQRDVNQLLERAKEINAGKRPKEGPSGTPERTPERKKLAEDATLYVRDGCRFCGSVLRAAMNLRCMEKLRIRDVNADPEARKALDAIAGPGSKVPVLVQNGEALRESGEIIRHLAEIYARV
jgi:glutaredoxin